MRELKISLLDDSGIKTLEEMLRQKPLAYNLDKLEEDLRWALPIVDLFHRESDGAYTTLTARTDDLFKELTREDGGDCYDNLSYCVRIEPTLGVVELEVDPREIEFDNHYDREKLEYLKGELMRIRQANMSLDSTLREFARANGFLYESPFKYKPEIAPKQQLSFPVTE